MASRPLLQLGLRAWTCAVAAASTLTTLAPMAVQAQAVADHEPPAIVTSSDQRHAYLAKARLWRERELPLPAEILEGPAGSRAGGATREQYNPADGIPCTYESGGAAMGGKTPKFTCRTADGRSMRVKYYSGDPRSGNREVFAEVVGTRLFWALGFPADIVHTITVNCQDCPSDPMNGTGPRKARRFIGVTEPRFGGLLILSKADPDQGWKFGELEEAIENLPDGPERAWQQANFDALRLLAIFVQHGDRKSEQQRLVCAGDVAEGAGDLHPLSRGDGSSFAMPAIFERPGASACSAPVALIQDLGATFGSSGQPPGLPGPAANPQRLRIGQETGKARAARGLSSLAYRAFLTQSPLPRTRCRGTDGAAGELDARRAPRTLRA